MNDHKALFELCELMFHEPERLIQVHCHYRHSSSWGIAVHRHEDLIQMDLSRGYGGLVLCGNRRIELEGTTAMVFYPGVRHGFKLIPRRSPSRIFSIKLRVPRTLRFVEKRIFPAAQKDVSRGTPLVRALERLYRLASVTDVKTPILISTLAEVLSFWPREPAHQMVPGAIGDWDSGTDEQIERAVTMIEHSLTDPLCLNELAQAVGMSKRHLIRRFSAMFGTSPHAYITRRRVMRAQELLAEGKLSVTEVADALGFLTIHAFSRWFRKEIGSSPTQYRQRPSLL